MRRLLLLGFASLGLAATAAAAPPQRSGSVITSSTRPGVKPVALTLSLTYEMQCGNPGKTPLTLTLPAQMTVPAHISVRSVRLNGRAPKSVAVHGHRVVVAIVQPQFLTCDVIGMGTLELVIEKSAGLGNPKAPGTYAFPVRIGKVQGAPMLRIL